MKNEHTSITHAKSQLRVRDASIPRDISNGMTGMLSGESSRSASEYATARYQDSRLFEILQSRVYSVAAQAATGTVRVGHSVANATRRGLLAFKKINTFIPRDAANYVKTVTGHALIIQPNNLRQQKFQPALLTI